MSASEYWSLVRTPAFTDSSANLFGKAVRFSNTEGFIHSVREIFYDNIYKFESQTAEPYVVDAGANIGLSVIYFKRMYPASRIVAYEPDPKIFGLLESNITSLGYDKVELRQAAAWVEETELTFYSEGSLAGSTEVDFLNKGQVTIVKAERLKDRLTGPRVDFLKIDIEGGENSVLFDIESELHNVENFFFEYHSVPGKDQRLGDMLNLVTKAGFRYVINGPHGPALPFVERFNEGFDLQLNVSCYRP
jgi:FkbM family methyltransferase